MNDSEKKDLIKKLGGMSNKAFDGRYSEPNRKWFVEKIIESLPWQSTAKADIESKTKDIISKAGVLLNARIKKGFSAGSLPVIWKLYDQLTSRTQIIYGMIAMHPQFLDAANEAYFDFILERRFRSIQRMNFYVNPISTRNVFAYPGDKEKMKVNKDSAGPTAPKQLWKAFLDNSIPFLLTGPGKSDPASTVETLFKSNRGSDRNLLACDPVATVLHMDALRAAKDPGKLLKAMANVDEQYLKIDNPLGHCANSDDGQRLIAVSSGPVSKGDHVDIPVGRVGLILKIIQDVLTPDMLQDDNFITLNRPKLKFMIVLGAMQESFTVQAVNPATRVIRAEKLTNTYDKAGAKIYVTRLIFPFYSSLPFHFITDSRSDHALFEQVMLRSGDLQVGDHIYVINHPLYTIYFPTGAWGGEHSFISEIESRDMSKTSFRSDLKVEGHGLKGTLLEMADKMLEHVNNILRILQTVTPIHLGNLKTNGRKNATFRKFKVAFTTRKEQVDSDTSPIDVNVFEYTGEYTYSAISDEGKKTIITKPGFVIKERTDNPDTQFWLFNYHSTDSTVDASHRQLFRRVVLVGSGPAEQFKVSKWAAFWFNAQTTRIEFLPLFDVDNKTPILLTFDELVRSKPFFATDDQGDVYVTRPRVDFSATYTKFLQDSGAI
jgi:hypothetical protein